MRGRGLVVAVIAAGIISGAACSDTYAEQVDACERSLQDNAAFALMLGSEGSTALCGCVVDSLSARFPDASDRWAEYTMALESRVESRGLLGLLGDTAWQNGQGREMAAFAQAHGEVMGRCGRSMIESSSLR